MIGIDFSRISIAEAYKLQIGSIVPRPVAWVSTLSVDAIPNLAPFSYFNGICSNPPALLFCPVTRADGGEKDSLRNIRETGEFVVNIATEQLVHAVNQSAAEYDRDVDEFAQVGVTPIDSVLIRPPRVAESPIQFECRLLHIVDVGSGPQSGHVVIGEIVYGHFATSVYQDGKISIEALRPIARLAGTTYCPVRDMFDLPRPTTSAPTDEFGSAS